jgi:FixJ family two-component response regulator
MLDAVRVGLEKDRKRRENEKLLSGLKAKCETLTPREQEVMALVTSGLMNKQVAGRLGVNEVTVKLHRGNLMRKMGAKSLADLVKMAEVLGVTSPPA